MRDSFCISQVKRYEHSYRSCPVYNLKRKIFKRNIPLWITVIFTTNFDNDTKKIIIFFFFVTCTSLSNTTLFGLSNLRFISYLRYPRRLETTYLCTFIFLPTKLNITTSILLPIIFYTHFPAFRASPIRINTRNVETTTIKHTCRFQFPVHNVPFKSPSPSPSLS